MILKLIAVMTLLFLTTACANQALFISNPIGAQVKINGEPIGITPCTFNYSSSSGDTYDVTVEKTGFKPLQHNMKADETDTSARNSWLAAGAVWSPLWLGTFFTKKLKDSYQFILKQDTSVVAMNK
jgi:hypothetical protein